MQPNALAFSPDSSHLALVTADASAVELYNLATGTLEQRYVPRSGQKITCIGYPSQEELLAIDISGAVENLLRGEQIYRLPKGQVARSLKRTQRAG